VREVGTVDEQVPGHGPRSTAPAIGLLAHDDSILLIPGTSSLEHLEENVAIGEVELSAGDVAELDAVAA